MRYREVSPSPASPAAGLVARVIRLLAKNPKSTIAGLATIAAACLPKYSGQIAAIAAGLGLMLAADAKDTTNG